MTSSTLQEFARRLGRAAAPWFDTRTRRPLILLVVASLSILLAPLAWDIAYALFYKLPRWLRRVPGEGAVIAAVMMGLRRLWIVRPHDTWPAEPDGPRRDAHVVWPLRIAVLSLAWPLLSHPDGLGFADWDFVLDKFEALRQTILRWGQFPWWHPWCRGGFPLGAEPQIGAVSMATPLVLAFGSTRGLALSTALCLLIAVEGAYRLAWRWLRDPWAAATAALVYGLNGGALVNTAWGYVLPMSYCSLPWMAYHAMRLGRRFRDGVGFGFWTAFAVLNGIQYINLYAGLLAGAFALRAWRLQPPGQRRRFLAHVLAAAGVFLLLCGWRLATVLPVLRDDQRERISFWDETPVSMLHYLLNRPAPDWPVAIPPNLCATFIELTSYVGPLVLGLGLASVVRGWRWWHTVALVGAWFALGSLRWYQPSYWVAEWPVFASTHVVTRWRFLAMLGLGLAAGSVLAAWRRSNRALVRMVAIAAAAVVALDLLSLAHTQLGLAFSLPADPERFPGPPVPTIVNVKQGVGYACVLRGYGVIQGYEPMVGGYRRDAPTLRRAREDPDYRGEAWTDAGPVEPTFWSPNRIEFQVRPGERVFVNQNPGSWWWANGRRAFPGLRCAELLEPFQARADAQGRLVLEIHPPGLEIGLALHVLGAALLLGAVAIARAGSREANSPPASAGPRRIDAAQPAPSPGSDQGGQVGEEVADDHDGRQADSGLHDRS